MIIIRCSGMFHVHGFIDARIELGQKSQWEASSPYLKTRLLIDLERFVI